MPRFSECWRCGCTLTVGIICKLCGVAKYCSEKCQNNDIFRHEAECIPASVLKTCTACRKSGPYLKACTGCYRAFYCDTNCQRSNWERHRIDCLVVKGRIELLGTAMLTLYFPRNYKSAFIPSCEYYYWGNTPAFDCLNLVENEGESYGSVLKVLFLGVGDLRNVALTCASLPDSYGNKICFTLNDRESSVLARLVLLLYILIKGASGRIRYIRKQFDAFHCDQDVEKMVTEIWYSIVLNESTYRYLITCLEELISVRCSKNLAATTAGLIMICEKQLKDMQMVWKRWLSLRVKGTHWIQNQRVQSFKNDTVLEHHLAFINIIPGQHVSSGKKWIEDGIFSRTQIPMTAFAENPTLTGYDPTTRGGKYSYRIEEVTFPFCSWDYVETKKFKNTGCLVTMYGDYIECILRRFMTILSRQQVSFQIVECDCMHIKQHLKKDAVFDRILTSNLVDYIFLPDMLKLCSDILNHGNTHATIVTETMTWERIYWQNDERIHMLETQQIKKIAEEDVKRSFGDINEGKTCTRRDYLNDSCEFNDYLRALFYAYHMRQGSQTNKLQLCKIPVTKELGKEFQLHLREGLQNENRIVFFKPAVNRRRVTMQNGNQRYLEWTPLQKNNT